MSSPLASLEGPPNPLAGRNMLPLDSIKPQGQGHWLVFQLIVFRVLIPEIREPPLEPQRSWKRVPKLKQTSGERLNLSPGTSFDLWGVHSCSQLCSDGGITWGPVITVDSNCHLKVSFYLWRKRCEVEPREENSDKQMGFESRAVDLRMPREKSHLHL